MDTQTLISYFEKLIVHYQDIDERRHHICNFFSYCLDNDYLLDLLNAIIESPLLLEYAEKEYLEPFWDLIIKEQLLYLDHEKNCFFLFQNGIKSFHLIFGFRLFLAACEQEENSSLQLKYLEKAIIFHSIHANIIYCDLLLDRYEKTYQYELINEILSIARKAFVHGMPGYYHYGKICYLLSKDDPILVKQGLIAFYVAKILEPNHKNEFHNAFIATPFAETNPYSLKDMDAVIDAYIKFYVLDKVTIQDAHQHAQIISNKWLEAKKSQNNFELG